MEVILLVLGLLIMLLGLVEGLWTTIWVDGNSSPFTGRFTTLIWKLFRRIVPKGNHKTLSLAGPTILAATVFSWIFFIWLGWTLMFYSDSTSLKVSNNPDFVLDFSDAAWFVSYTMFTVGNGDFLPQDGIWQVISAIVAFTGMAMVTLSITYILQVVSAVATKRAFASEVMSIGKSAEEFVIKQWTGNDFGAFELQLNSLSSQLSLLSEQHLAFPILHYYHAARVQKSQDVAVAILDDALNIIKLGMEESNLPPETILSSARQSVSSFLTTVKTAFIHPAENAPAKPDLELLREKNIPVISDEEFHKKINKENGRRKLMMGLIDNGAWQWPENKNTYG